MAKSVPATTPPPDASGARPARRPLTVRIIITLGIGLPLLSAVALWLVTRSWFLVLVTVPGLEQKLGGEVTIGSASYRGSGRLVFEDVQVRSRAHVGMAAQALRIARAEIVVDPGSIFSGLEIREVELDGVLIRFSEDKRTPGVFNLGSLTPDWSTSREGPLLPPTVRIHSAVVELGMHVGAEYEKVGHRRVSGEMYPAPEGGGWYAFELQELDDHGVSLGANGISVQGRWNVESLEHRALVQGLTLDDRMYGMCPQVARLWWQRMQPEGPVGSAVIEWKQGEPYVAELNVDRMALTIPIVAGDAASQQPDGHVDAVASLPRMFVHSGTIRLVGNHLTLDNLIGEFSSTGQRETAVEMPYRVNFSIHDLPPFDWENQPRWMEQVISTSPFEMSVRMDNFRFAQDEVEPGQEEEELAVQLPRPVADTLAKFNLRGWSLDTQVEIVRDKPDIGPDGDLVPAPIRTIGKAYISDASGAFGGFPYPLDEVDAYVEFDSERVILHYLTGKGAGDSTVRMTGWIAPVGKEAAITLTLTARDVPLDDRFRQALKGGQLATFDVMLHEPSYENLKAEGLLPDEAAVMAAQKRRQELLARINDPDAQGDGGEDPERIRREIDRLGAIVDAGTFELGGVVDMDLLINRPPGDRRPVEITGTVDVQRAGVVYGRFPYPIHVLGGRLEVKKDRVVIVDQPDGTGIPIATALGGRGEVSGEVVLERTGDGKSVRPALSVVLMGDYLSDLLYAAMPLTEQDKQDTNIAALRPVPRRSLIARLLAGAGITGYLNHTGIITADDDGRPSFDFAVELYDARAEPNQELFETMTELGLPSPRGLTLDSVHALIQLTPDGVRLVDFTGKRGPATITADADVNLHADPIETDLRIQFDDLELERYMVELTPGAGREKTEALWDRFQPQGTYDARLQYRKRGERAELAELVIWPNTLRIMLDGEPMWLMCDSGRLAVKEGQVVFDDFLFKLRSGDRDDGTLELDGAYGLADDKSLRLEGRWSDGQLASPLIPEALKLIGADAHAERYRVYNPTGLFDASFFFQSPRGDEPAQYEFAIRPATLGFTYNETPIFLELDPGSEIAFRPGRIAIRDFSGSHAGGKFGVDGGIDVGELIDADLDLTYLGRIDSPQLVAMLPQPVHAALDKLDIQAADPVRLRTGRLQFSEGEAGWDTEFSGMLETHGASMTAAGIDFTEVDGEFELAAWRNAGSGTTVEIGVHADRALAMGRELTNVVGQFDIEGEAGQITMPHLRAEAYGGVITGRAGVGLKDDSDYNVAIDLGGIGLTGIVAPDDPEVERARSRGRAPGGEVYGSFRMNGKRGVTDSRRGRGAMRVVYGRMADMPVALRILQLVELMPPVSGTLDFADMAFYIEGRDLVFEQLFLECPTLQMIGYGRMTVPEGELDLRMRTQGTLPVVRDIVAAVSNTLFQVQVTGTIKQPEAKLIPLPGDNQAARESSSSAQAQAR